MGPDYTSSLMNVKKLGLLYADQSKYKNAEKMYGRALDRKEKHKFLTILLYSTPSTTWVFFTPITTNL